MRGFHRTSRFRTVPRGGNISQVQKRPYGMTQPVVQQTAATSPYRAKPATCRAPGIRLPATDNAFSGVGNEIKIESERVQRCAHHYGFAKLNECYSDLSTLPSSRKFIRANISPPFALESSYTLQIRSHVPVAYLRLRCHRVYRCEIG